MKKFDLNDFEIALKETNMCDVFAYHDPEFVVSLNQYLELDNIDLCFPVKFDEGLDDDVIIVRSVDRSVCATWLKGRGWIATSRTPTIEAINMILRYGGTDGEHHKQWVIDQVLRILVGDKKKYDEVIKRACEVEDKKNKHEWDVGISP